MADPQESLLEPVPVLESLLEPATDPGPGPQMTNALFIKTQKRRPHTSFRMFDDESGRILMSAKRTWAGYSMYDEHLATTIGEFNFNWGRTVYELTDLSAGGEGAARVTYNFSNAYADFALYDLKQDKSFNGKRPVWNEEKRIFVMTFHRQDYKASAKNFQLMDEDENTVVELGKIEDGYYRIQYVDGFHPLSIVALAITRFHV